MVKYHYKNPAKVAPLQLFSFIFLCSPPQTLCLSQIKIPNVYTTDMCCFLRSSPSLGSSYPSESSVKVISTSLSSGPPSLKSGLDFLVCAPMPTPFSWPRPFTHTAVVFTYPPPQPHKTPVPEGRTPSSPVHRGTPGPNNVPSIRQSRIPINIC